jgi:hypothetical protein
MWSPFWPLMCPGCSFLAELRGIRFCSPAGFLPEVILDSICQRARDYNSASQLLNWPSCPEVLTSASHLFQARPTSKLYMRPECLRSLFCTVDNTLDLPWIKSCVRSWLPVACIDDTAHPIGWNRESNNKLTEKHQLNVIGYMTSIC